MRSVIVGIISLAFLGGASAQQAEVKYISLGSVEWRTPDPLNEIRVATIAGNPRDSGFYSIYVSFPAGAKVPPHVHRDQRVVTVVSGTYYSGLGNEFDERQLKPMTPGMSVIIPANTPHYAIAKDGPILVIESGTAPTNTKLVSELKAEAK